MDWEFIIIQAIGLMGNIAVIGAVQFNNRKVVLGAQALGVMELGHSAHMLSIAPLTAGLPMAVSCLTARQGDRRALSAGCSLVRRLCCVLIPAWLLLCGRFFCYEKWTVDRGQK